MPRLVMIYDFTKLAYQFTIQPKNLEVITSLLCTIQDAKAKLPSV
jgi:hypothetical protein